MRKLLVAAAAAFLASCSSSKSFNPTPPEPLTGVYGNTTIAQHIAFDQLGGADPDGEVASPGHPNAWDLNPDFSLEDGNDDQWDGALELALGTVTSPATFTTMDSDWDVLAPFPEDQLYDELTFFGPLAKKADGVVTAAVFGADPFGNDYYQAPIAGTYSAYLAGTSDSRLSQTLALPAVSGGDTLTLSFSFYAEAGDSYFDYDVIGYNPYFRVVVRAANGDVVATPLAETTGGSGLVTFDLTSVAGQTVSISFEYRSNDYWSEELALVDDVSVESSAAPGTNLIHNGDFETGDLTGWTINDTGEPTGIASGTRTVAGLDIQRFFYTVPGNKWARWADVFTNSGATAVTTDVVYLSNLGSDGGGIVYATPGTAGKAFTAWDGSADDRDTGIAFGSDQAFYQSASALSSYDNVSDNTYLLHTITVPPGKSVVLVHFIVLTAVDTGSAAADITAKATDADQALAAIVAGIWSDPQYLTGMTAAQIAAIANW